MTKRNCVRVVSFSVGIALVCLGFLYKTERQNKVYVLSIENTYSYMLDELNTAASSIADTLNKTRFLTTKPQLSRMASKLLCEAEISKSTLSQLPVAENLSALNRFFSQVGNYAFALAEGLDENGISVEDTASVERLSEISKTVAELLYSSRESYNNLEYWATRLDSQVAEATDKKGLGISLTQLEDELKDYPTLIYDGPYSDHILDKEPLLLKNTAQISEDESHKNAVRWSGIGMYDLKYAGSSEGKIATFDFLSENASVSVTKQGGYLLYLRKQREISDILLSYEQSLLKAMAYLDNLGMENMRETYYYESDGICVINFAFLDGKTLCYTDLIKVGVALDNGEIVFYEAGGYITNHTVRAFKVPQISEEQAAAIISSKLKVNGVRLALIPTNNREETRCYEFNCTSADEQDVLVYINTLSLKEEEILILQRSDGGVLVK